MIEFDPGMVVVTTLPEIDTVVVTGGTLIVAVVTKVMPGAVLMMTDPTSVCVDVEMLVTPGSVTVPKTVTNCVLAGIVEGTPETVTTDPGTMLVLMTVVVETDGGKVTVVGTSDSLTTVTVAPGNVMVAPGTVTVEAGTIVVMSEVAVEPGSVTVEPEMVVVLAGTTLVLTVVTVEAGTTTVVGITTVVGTVVGTVTELTEVVVVAIVCVEMLVVPGMVSVVVSVISEVDPGSVTVEPDWVIVVGG